MTSSADAQVWLQFWKITEHFADTSARKANPQSGKFTG